MNDWSREVSAMMAKLGRTSFALCEFLKLKVLIMKTKPNKDCTKKRLNVLSLRVVKYKQRQVRQ